MPLLVRIVLYTLAMVFVVAVAGFAIFRIVFIPTVLYGNAMTPAYHDGQLLVFNRLSYLSQRPHRGDVIAFAVVPPGQRKRVFVQRIVAIPGDDIAVRAGEVWIDGKRDRETYSHARAPYSFGPARVPVNDYFVLGDNRANSYDSHVWGWLPRAAIEGKLAFTR